MSMTLPRKILFAIASTALALGLTAIPASAQQYPPSTPTTKVETTTTEGDTPEITTTSTSSPLARTGLDATTLGTIALAVLGAGAVLVAASRRPARRF